jgi:phenylpropionate dioxygenase-like ring-hydroxylating dioxygenase large terminal subunit
VTVVDLHRSSPTLSAPPASAFPDWPIGWYRLCPSARIGQRPIAVDVIGRRLACYRASDGHVVAMDARCWHMGGDLASGTRDGDNLRCPFHGWCFARDGRCRSIPAQATVPPAARQPTFATAERAGNAYVFAGPEAAYPLPFFEETDAPGLVAASPFEFEVAAPWWLVGTNGFDLQHFMGAHDRRLAAEPTVRSPHERARQIIATFDVCGGNLRDRLTRRFAGREVTMHVTVWSGCLAFVMARFRRRPDERQPRTTSYGMVEIVPAAAQGSAPRRTRVRITIFARRRRGRSWIASRADAAVRRHFIRAFLEPDARLLEHARYEPEHFVEADRVLVDYLRWLASVSHGDLFPAGEFP